MRRVEESAGGRTVIGVAIMVILLAVVVTNLPQTMSLRESLSKKTQPILNAIGLDQNWGVFAPDPRRQVIGMEVRIGYPDGSMEVWEPPVRDDVIGTYSDYRWQKLMENVINDAGGDLTRRTAAWVAREKRSRPERPDVVRIVSRAADLPPPGPMAGKPLRFKETTILDLPLTDAMLREGGQ